MKHIFFNSTRVKLLLLTIPSTLLLRCSQTADKQFKLLDSDQTGIYFTNSIESTNNFNILTYRNFYNGGGVGIGDINNDQLPDIYLISNMGPNKLYLNHGDMKFEDITEKAGISGSKGWCTGVSMVDVNADGFLDIYVTNAGTKGGQNRQNELFINQGDLTFQEQGAVFGLNDSGISTHAAFFDYDLDGDLDAYILNNSFISARQLNYNDRRKLYAEDWNLPDSIKGGGDKLYRNDGSVFKDVTRESGIYGSLIGFGLGITLGDVNADNYPDIYISNDFYERDYLYINQGDGSFKDMITEYMGHISMFSMGADMADLNNDGYPEIFVTDMLAETDERVKTRVMFEDYNTYLIKQDRGFFHQYVQNTLQLNNKDGSFSEVSRYSGVSATDWSWGALIFDGDNDGRKDLFVSNGVFHDMTDLDFVSFFANDALNLVATSKAGKGALKMIERMPSEPLPNKYFRNVGDMKFEDVGDQIGFETATFSNGSAYGDLDNDGDLDLVVNNLNERAYIYQNQIDNTNHYLSLDLTGDSLNPFAVGSKVKAYVNQEMVFAELYPTRGFQSSVDYTLVLGLGSHEQVDSLDIIWPNGQILRRYNVPSDTSLSIAFQKNPELLIPPASKPQNPLFTEIEHSIRSYDEDYYFDFFYEGLLAKMISQEGPDVAIGDVNGDGLDDLYIGGPANAFGLLYFQEDGSFQAVKSRDIALDHRSEDTEVLFFDADGDQDLDLFVGSGGNITTAPKDERLDRLYLNDGEGNFAKTNKALPKNYHNTAVALAIDFDEDGDQDLLVANRSVPGVYGLIPESYLYENDGKGSFKDVTSRSFPELTSLGMVTDAIVGDLNSNEFPDLIFVGEWMAPVAYELREKQFRRLSTGLENYSGWWGGVEIADLDNDGDMDLIMGNAGENSPLQTSQESPLKLWIKDFDHNGTMEKILTRYIDQKDKPVASKSDITGQLPFLKKENLKHAVYARQGMTDLFSSDQLANVSILEANTFKSVVAMNNGTGYFTIQDLPWKVQLSCVCAIYCKDLNADGYLDIVLGGNDDTYQTQFAKQDASNGHVLINDQNGGFNEIPYESSGFSVRGEIKKLQELNLQGQQYLLVTRNEDKPRLYRIPQ